MWTTTGKIKNLLAPKEIECLGADFVEATILQQNALGLSSYVIEFGEEVEIDHLTIATNAHVPKRLEKLAHDHDGENVKFDFDEFGHSYIVDYIFEPQR